jgi:hypothetical protein
MRRAVLTNRYVSVVVAAALLTTLISGTALAKPPKYLGAFTATPGAVSQEGLVRFDVSWKNTSGSSLPKLFMHADTPAGATLVALAAGPSKGTCTVTAALDCNFGGIAKNQTVTFGAFYQTPSSGGSMTVKFNFTVQGSSPNDKKGSSRGDDMPVNASVTLNSATSDTAGSYIFSTFTIVQNNPDLGEGNTQSAKLDFTDSGEENFAATVTEEPTDICVPAEDEETYWESSYPPETPTCFGDFVVMHVKQGNPVEGGFFVTLGYTNVPEDAQGAFIHWLVDNPGAVSDPQEGVDFEIIDQTCEETGGDMPCISDEFGDESGNHFWVLHIAENGPMRGF